MITEENFRPTRDEVRCEAAQALLIALIRRGHSDITIAYHCGVSPRAVYRWREKGRTPNQAPFLRLCDFAQREGVFKPMFRRALAS